MSWSSWLKLVLTLMNNCLIGNQSAFRKGRGLTDALFTIPQVITKSVVFDQPLFMAFVDLRKAYYSVSRDTAVADPACVWCTHEAYRLADGSTYGNTGCCADGLCSV
jgi:hypothetical protein